MPRGRLEQGQQCRLGRRSPSADRRPHRSDGVTTIGVDEHFWSRIRHRDEYVTVIIDLILIRFGTGPSKLLDPAAGRSNQAHPN